MIYFRITRDRGALSVDKTKPQEGSFVILSEDPQDDYQLWQLSLHVDNEWNVGIVIINKATGMLICPENERVGAKVKQHRVPDGGKVGEWGVWQTNVVNGDRVTMKTIMPLLNENLAISSLFLSQEGKGGEVALKDWNSRDEWTNVWTLKPIFK